MENSLLKYEALVKSVESGSLTKAATSLFYSQSGISRMIRDLETEWGFSILKRSKKGVVLTSNGEMIYPLIKEIVVKNTELNHKIASIKGLSTGTIVIGVFTSISAGLLPDILSRFNADYPEIDFILIDGDYREIESALINGRIDCGFVRLPNSTGSEAISVRKDEYRAVVPAGHLLSSESILTLADICEYSFLLLEKNGISDVADYFENNGYRPKIIYRSWDDIAILAMIERGIGISILPEYIIHRTNYNVVEIPLQTPLYREIGFLVNDNRAVSPAVKEFLEYVY